jgi:hypothetical protein
MVEFNGSKVLKDQWLSKTGGVQWTSLDAIYRTENPRVGGSIPPLATIHMMILKVVFRPHGLPCVENAALDQ